MVAKIYHQKLDLLLTGEPDIGYKSLVASPPPPPLQQEDLVKLDLLTQCVLKITEMIGTSCISSQIPQGGVLIEYP